MPLLQDRDRAETAPSRRAVYIVIGAILVDTIGFGVVTPVLPELITRVSDQNLIEASRTAGWMLVIFALGQFFAGPIMGQLGDRFGRRPVLMIAMFAFAADYLLMAWAPSLFWLFLGRVIAGVSGAVLGPASAAIADVTRPERRSAAFGMVGAAFGVGFIVGPALGGIVAAIGPRAPFMVAAGLAALNAVAMLLLLPETLKPENRRPFRLRDAHLLGSFKPLFEAGNAAPLLVAWLLWQLGSLVYPATWAFWGALTFGWDARAIGLSLAYIGLMMVLVQSLLTGRIVGRLGEKRAAILGLFCSAVTMFAYAFASEGWQVYAFFAVGAIGAVAYPALNGALSKMVDASRQGALQGGIASLNSAAAVAGPLLFSQTLAAGAAQGFAGAALLVAGALTAAAGLIIIKIRV